MIAQSKRKVIFTSYNRMKREGADKGRLNRALGLAQRSQPRPYTTTADSCDCPDSQFRGVVCKHRIAVMMTQAEQPEVKPATRRTLAEINSDLFGD